MPCCGHLSEEVLGRFWLSSAADQLGIYRACPFGICLLPSFQIWEEEIMNHMCLHRVSQVVLGLLGKTGGRGDTRVASVRKLLEISPHVPQSQCQPDPRQTLHWPRPSPSVTAAMPLG